jgi:hypothetical protein
MTPADLRGYVYRTLNQSQDGVVSLAERPPILEELAAPLGLSGELLGELLHLDAERNQVLIRVGPRPEPADVAARFNALLTVSLLRQASSIELTLPGLDPSLVETVCARDEVPYRRLGSDTIRLQGRRNAAGSWTGFGGRSVAIEGSRGRRDRRADPRGEPGRVGRTTAAAWWREDQRLDGPAGARADRRRGSRCASRTALRPRGDCDCGGANSVWRRQVCR